jgi:hypothetical protein
MVDAVDVVECKNAANTTGSVPLDGIHPSIQAAIDAWLTDAGTPSSFDRSYPVTLGPNRKAVVIEYTTA